MSHLLNFGQYNGRSLEWVVFHDPCHIMWIVKKGIHLDQSKFSHEARIRLEELVKRGSHLRIPGYCPWCNERDITRIFLTFNRKRKIVNIHFDCNRCKPGGSSFSQVYTPSLFLLSNREYNSDIEIKFFVSAVKKVYFGNTSVRLTQERLEEFFDDPYNFVNF